MIVKWEVRDNGVRGRGTRPVTIRRRVVKAAARRGIDIARGGRRGRGRGRGRGRRVVVGPSGRRRRRRGAAARSGGGRRRRRKRRGRGRVERARLASVAHFTGNLVAGQGVESGGRQMKGDEDEKEREGEK